MQKEEFEKMVDLIPTLTNLIKPEEIPEIRKIHFFWGWERGFSNGYNFSIEVVQWDVDFCEANALEYYIKRIAARDCKSFRLVFLFDNAKTKGQTYLVPDKIKKQVDLEFIKEYAPDYADKIEKKAKKIMKARGLKPRSS